MGASVEKEESYSACLNTGLEKVSALNVRHRQFHRVCLCLSGRPLSDRMRSGPYFWLRGFVRSSQVLFARPRRSSLHFASACYCA